jgi:hypothetical protein
MATLVLFFDGIGVGENDSRSNPFAAIEARRLAPLAGGPCGDGAGFRALDATLGVPGLPQSATGQTTLLTGVNAARVAGRHQTGVPGPTLRPIIERESLFLKLVRAGLRPTFANAYTKEHLEARRPRWSATTRAVMASGIPFRMWDREGRDGRALFHDYTGEWLRRRGFDIPALDADGAAAVLAGLLTDHDLVLYEYFLTDLAAHRGDWDQKVEQARRVEALVDAVLRLTDLERDLVVVVSDHGNLEDAATKQHTLNPVPFVVWGRRRFELLDRVDSMESVAPTLVAWTGAE